MLGFQHQIANIHNVVILQAIGGANRQFKLVNFTQQVPAEWQLWLRWCWLAFWLFEIDECLQLLLQNTRGICHRIIRRDRAIGFDCQQQLVIIGDLTNTRIFNLVSNLLDWAEDGINRDQTNRRILGEQRARRYISLACIDGQFHRQ